MDRALMEDYLRELHHRSREMTAESLVMGSGAKPSSSVSSDQRVAWLADAPGELLFRSVGWAGCLDRLEEHLSKVDPD